MFTLLPLSLRKWWTILILDTQTSQLQAFSKQNYSRVLSNSGVLLSKRGLLVTGARFSFCKIIGSQKMREVVTRCHRLCETGYENLKQNNTFMTKTNYITAGYKFVTWSCLWHNSQTLIGGEWSSCFASWNQKKWWCGHTYWMIRGQTHTHLNIFQHLSICYTIFYL